MINVMMASIEINMLYMLQILHFNKMASGLIVFTTYTIGLDPAHPFFLHFFSLITLTANCVHNLTVWPKSILLVGYRIFYQTVNSLF